jgi:hypothetical protein
VRFPRFIGGSDPAQSPLVDVERTVNFYVEHGDVDALYPTPGFRSFVGPTAGIVDVGTRALWGGRTSGTTEQCFGVIGASLYEVFADQTVTRRGPVAIDANPAQIVYNGTAGGQLLVSAGGNAYCYDLAAKTLTQVLTGDATMIAILDERGVALNANTGIARYSALNNFNTWDPTNFFQNSTTSDPWLMMLADRNRELWFIGEKTGQVYYTTTDPDNAYLPIPGAVFGYGTLGSFAGAVAGQNLVWLGRNEDGSGFVVSARGYVPQIVSSYAVNTALAGYARSGRRLSDAEIVAYHDQGHTFWNLGLPSANATWSFDVEQPNWHERGAWNAPLNQYDLWRPRAHCYVFGQHLVGDRATGTIATMDTTFGTEIDGSAIRRLRRAPAFNVERKRVRYDQFELLVETGLGVAAGQGSAPVVMLRYSDDAGRTWSNERQASAGRMGDFAHRVYWNQLGISANRVFEVSMTDPIPWRITDALVNNYERYGVSA